MFGDYRHECLRGNLSVGVLHLWRLPNPNPHNRRILNFPTKNHWRDPSNPMYVRSGLMKFALVYRSLGIDSIAFPMLGCGLGGLDRGEVGHLMREYLEKLESLNVEIYTR